jgi:hypothetical protein
MWRTFEGCLPLREVTAVNFPPFNVSCAVIVAVTEHDCPALPVQPTEVLIEFPEALAVPAWGAGGVVLVLDPEPPPDDPPPPVEPLDEVPLPPEPPLLDFFAGDSPEPGDPATSTPSVWPVWPIIPAAPGWPLAPSAASGH